MPPTDSPPRRLRILVLHGPNLARLGERDPAHYGRRSLADIDRELIAVGADLGADVEAFQSNDEGALVDKIHASGAGCDGIIINAGGLTHTSVVLRDALSVGPPAVEVHLSQTAARASFRHPSLIARVCMATVSGFGPGSYRLALEGLVAHLRADAA